MAKENAQSAYDRIKGIESYQERQFELARLKINDPAVYEEVKNIANTNGERIPTSKDFFRADEYVAKAQKQYGKIKAECNNDSKKMMEAVNKIRAKGNDGGDLLVACANADGKKWNIKKEKQQENTEQYAEAEKKLTEYLREAAKGKDKRPESVKGALDKFAKEDPDAYRTMVDGVNKGKIKVTEELKGYIQEHSAAEKKAEAQNRTDRGKLYEVVDKDLRALKTDEEKASFAKKLEVFSQRSGYSHEYYKAAVVLVDSKKYPEDVENLVRETDKKVKEKAAKANEGAENGGNSGNEGGAGGGRSGGKGGRAGGRSSGNMMTLDRACAVGPTAIMEFIENDLKKKIDGKYKKEKKGHTYIPTSKLQNDVIPNLPEGMVAEIEKYINSPKFMEDVDRINKRDGYTPGGRTNGNGGRTNGAGDAGGNNGNDEAPEPLKVEKTEDEQRKAKEEAQRAKIAGYEKLFADKTPEEIAQIKQAAVNANQPEEFAAMTAAEESIKKDREAIEKARQEEIAKYKKLYAENKDEFNKQRETAERIGDKKKFDIMNEAEKVAKAEERDLYFKRYKKLLEDFPDKFESTKETARKQVGVLPDAERNLKLMEDVEKYVKLEKQMKKDKDKADKKYAKAKEALDKGKTDKSQKLQAKGDELTAEAKQLEAQMEALKSGKQVDARDTMKKDSTKAKESETKEKKGNIFKRAGNYISEQYSHAKDYVEKKNVSREVSGNITTFTLSGFEGREVMGDKPCNGTYTLEYKDNQVVSIKYKDKKGNEAPLTFDSPEKMTDYARNLGKLNAEINGSAAVNQQQNTGESR